MAILYLSVLGINDTHDVYWFIQVTRSIMLSCMIGGIALLGLYYIMVKSEPKEEIIEIQECEE